MNEETRAKTAKEQAFKMMGMSHVNPPKTNFDRRFMVDWIEKDLSLRGLFSSRGEVGGFIKEFFGDK